MSPCDRAIVCSLREKGELPGLKTKCVSKSSAMIGQMGFPARVFERGAGKVGFAVKAFCVKEVLQQVPYFDGSISEELS